MAHEFRTFWPTTSHLFGAIGGRARRSRFEMNDIANFIMANAGPLFAFAVFLGNRVIQESRDRHATRQRVKERLDDATIRDYVEWLRNRDHRELLQVINERYEDLYATLLQLGSSIEGLPGQVQSALAGGLSDVKCLLDNLTATIQKPVLSSIPLHCRGILARELLFRARDLEELGHRSGDTVLSGQPGAGKTFLLYHLARPEGGRFVTSANPDEVLAALRYSCPPLVIVDDAADKIDLLQRIFHFRVESGAVFRIIAVGWPFEEDSLLRVLSLPKTSAYRLELITADEMAELVTQEFRTVGLRAENWLVREVQQQAAGRPGLALRLVDLIAAEQNLRALVDGTVHYEVLERAFRDLSHQDPSEILAGFAVGGRTGMRKEDVAELLGRSDREVSNVLRTLATGGIIAQTSDVLLATQPASFRHALLKKEFLTGDALARSEKYKDLFDRAPDRKAALATLITAVSKGAKIEDGWLLDQVQAAHDSGIWGRLAHLNKSWCSRVIDRFPGNPEEIAEPALHYIPEMIIPKLLDLMTGDTRRPWSYLGFCCAERQLDDWVAELPTHHDGVERRKLLLGITRRWMDAGGDPEAGWRALLKCVSLTYEGNESDPGSGRRFTWSRGTARLKEVRQLEHVWDELLDVARSCPPTNWKAVAHAMNRWLSPSRIGGALEDGMTDVTRARVKAFVLSLIELPNIRVLGLCRWAVENSLLNPCMADPEFLSYCPLRPNGSNDDRRAIELADSEAARNLGLVWSTSCPSEIADKVAVFEAECRNWDVTYGICDWLIFSTLAERIANPREWLEACFARGLRPNVLKPFLKKLTEAGDEQSSSWLLKLLQSPQFQTFGVEFALGLDAVSSEVQKAVAPLLTQLAEAVGTWLGQGRISSYWVGWLAMNARGELALSVAIHDFRSKEQEILGKDRAKWLALFLRGIAGLQELDSLCFCDLDELIAAVPDVRMPLVSEILANNRDIHCSVSLPYAQLLGSLTREERVQLLPRLGNVWPSHFTALLVGDDTIVYAELLARSELREHHLVPLIGDPTSEPWQAKARLALDAGYKSDEVARAVICTGSDYREWVSRFAGLAASADTRMREVGAAAMKMLKQREVEAECVERREAIYGIGDDD